MNKLNVFISLWGKLLKNKKEAIEDQGEKQVDALKSLEFSYKQLLSIKDFISKESLNSEISNEIERIEKEERKADGSIYKASNETYDFRKFKTIRVLVMKLEIILLT